VATAAHGVDELLAAGAHAAFPDFRDTAAVVGALLS
jgi:hypothetical protein